MLSQLLRRRALLPALASVTYVGVAALRHRGQPDLESVLLVLAGLVLAGLAAHAGRRALAWALWASGVAVAALARGDDAPGFLGAAGAVAGAVGLLSAAWALRHVPALGGMVAPRARGRAFVFAVVGLPWALPVAAHLARAFHRAPSLADHAVAFSLAVPAISVASLLLLVVVERLDRRLELGPADRLGATATMLILLGAGALAVLLVRLLPPRSGVALLAAAASVVTVAALLLGDPVGVARAARRAVVLGGGGAFVAIVVGVAAADRPFAAAVLVVLGVVGALAVGAAMPALETQLQPVQGALLGALADASRALRRSDPDAALADALSLVRRAAGEKAESPELWLLDPATVIGVDAAGYARARPAELPPALLDLASGEPEATLRADALRALEVRRPDLRSLLAFLDDHGALAASLVTSGGEVVGMLVLPRGARGEPLSLEEVRGLKAFADELAATCSARASLARSMRREAEATRAADDAEGRAERLAHSLSRSAAHHVRATSRLARPATVGIYAAASRMAYDALERLAKAGAPVVAVARSGVDPVPFLARAHLSGARAEGPFVLVDGTSAREHDVARWKDPIASPLALADGGALVLLDGGALPADVQQLIGQSIAERRVPWERAEPLDVIVVLTTVIEPAVLLESGRLDGVLASRLGAALEEPVRLPSIAERPEDLRAIFTDRLAREGLRVRGRPVGMDDAAFARLVEWPLSGEDAEIATIVQRLVARCEGEVVREPDVAALEEVRPAGAADPGPGVGGQALERPRLSRRSGP